MNYGSKASKLSWALVPYTPGGRVFTYYRSEDGRFNIEPLPEGGFVLVDTKQHRHSPDYDSRHPSFSAATLAAEGRLLK